MCESALRSPPTGCQVTSRQPDRFSRYSKWPDTFRTALICNASYWLSFIPQHRNVLKPRKLYSFFKLFSFFLFLFIISSLSLFFILSYVRSSVVTLPFLRRHFMSTNLGALAWDFTRFSSDNPDKTSDIIWTYDPVACYDVLPGSLFTYRSLLRRFFLDIIQGVTCTKE
jgi:hypothetical protein